MLEISNGQLAKHNKAAVVAARKAFPKEWPVGVIVTSNDSILEQAKKLPFTKLIVCRSSCPTAETIAPLLAKIQETESFSHWWTAHSAFGKDLFPRFVGELLRGKGDLNVVPISDITRIVDSSTFVRPIYAGNAVTTVQAHAESLKVVTIRPTSFTEDLPSDTDCKIQQFEFEPSQEQAEMCRWIEDRVSTSERPDLGSAEVVISGGRALKSAEGFKLLYDMADALGNAASKDY